MAKFYSKSTNGFYDSIINKNTMPSDAVAISDEAYEEILIEQSSGRQVASDESGNPITVDAPALSFTKQAQEALNASDMVAIRCFKAGIVFPEEWKAYIAALRIIVANNTGPLPAKPNYPAGS